MFTIILSLLCVALIAAIVVFGLIGTKVPSKPIPMETEFIDEYLQKLKGALSVSQERAIRGIQSAKSDIEYYRLQIDKINKLRNKTENYV